MSDKKVIGVVVGFADGTWCREEVDVTDVPDKMLDETLDDLMPRRHPEPNGGAELDRYRMVFWLVEGRERVWNLWQNAWWGRMREERKAGR